MFHSYDPHHYFFAEVIWNKCKINYQWAKSAIICYYIYIKVIHVHHDLRQMFITLVWNVQQSFSSYNSPSCSLLCMLNFNPLFHYWSCINLMTLNYTLLDHIIILRTFWICQTIVMLMFTKSPNSLNKYEYYYTGYCVLGTLPWILIRYFQELIIILAVCCVLSTLPWEELLLVVSIANIGGTDI